MASSARRRSSGRSPPTRRWSASCWPTTRSGCCSPSPRLRRWRANAAFCCTATRRRRWAGRPSTSRRSGSTSLADGAQTVRSQGRGRVVRAPPPAARAAGAAHRWGRA
ncbi:hypothetical protein GBAR_LOCUS21774 [Geodia barretti]|uniref:Uncharacterized protein n=1 Tax=Geodia barretti TaxID=519541 RepID=A0AA35T0S5_GEOBA|nr:hypothetical protein GBAR_LOCUS21774 [Geodia barretti]